MVDIHSNPLEMRKARGDTNTGALTEAEKHVMRKVVALLGKHIKAANSEIDSIEAAPVSMVEPCVTTIN
jgi:hypothetical protein